MFPPTIYWTQIISAIIQLYLKETTVCVIWNSQLEFDLKINNFRQYFAVININLKTLQNSFQHDVTDFKVLEQRLQENGVGYNELTEKLTMAIEKAHCESFVAFQDDILLFIESFMNASQYSHWRSKRNRFVFGYQNETYEDLFEQHKFFEDQDAILLVTLDPLASHIFNLKTNKFCGKKSEKQSALVFLDQFNALNKTFLYNRNLFHDKIANLQGREIIATGFDYRPYFVMTYIMKDNNSYDLAYGNSNEGAVHIDGTEARVLMAFCELYNCTILIDSSEATDWGEVYPNLTGEYSLGMVAKDMVEITIASMYSWDTVYLQLDMSMYLVRTGVTCLVPAAKRLASFLLPLQPFQYTLWLAVLAYLFIEMICLCFTYKFEISLSSQRGTWYESLKYGFVTTIRLFLSQSSDSDVQSYTLRVFLFTCFMNDIIITSIYGGGLASILTIPSYEKAADTIDGLLYYKLDWVGISDAWTIAMRNTDDPRMNDLLNNFYAFAYDELELFSLKRLDMAFALERLPFGHFALGDFLSSEGLEHLKIMKEDLYFQYTVAFVKRCWPMLDRFDQLVYWWHSAGLDKYWEWRVVAAYLNVKKQKQVEATMYANTDEGGPEKLGMSNFIGMLLIWFIGILISVLGFLYEVMKHYFKFRTCCT